MAKIPSKRLRLRIFLEEDQALDELLTKTAHTTKSHVIRGALTFLDQVWSSARGGFRVIYWREGISQTPGVLETTSAPVRSEAEPRPRTEKSIEIRLTRADSEKIERLLAMEAGDTFSDVVRRAIRLYAVAVSRGREGWEVVAVSPSGDVLPLPVPGLGVRASAYPEAAGIPAGESAVRVSDHASRLSELLPRSLVDTVARLAARETCSTEVLLTDMIRVEAFARLNPPQEREAPEPETEATATVEIVPATEKAPTEAPPTREADNDMIEAIAKTLDQMADNIEKVMQLVGETTRSKSQQAQFSDLLFGATPEMEELASTSDTERLFVRAKELNERLNALVALTQRQGKGKGERDKAKAEDERDKAKG